MILVEKKYKIIIYLFFALFFVVGINIFKDYGVPWDEVMSRNNGVIALRYILNGDQSLFHYIDRDCGPAFEMFLVAIEKSLNIMDNPRAALLMRHLATFLLFYLSVVFFYLICKERFQSWKIGLLGSLFLILSPRIFADSFYNSKDIAFLSLFIISIYSLFRYLNKRTLLRAFIHALMCAFLIDIRIVGVIVPFFTVIFFIIDAQIVKLARVDVKNYILSIFIYLFSLIFFTVLFWPTLWKNPLINFLQAFLNMSNFRWSGTVLYLGNYIDSAALPWHYIPMWIIISTPISYIAFFCVGCFIILKLFITNPLQFYFRTKYDLIFMLWISLPLFIVIILKSILYDAWRHMFFLYPALLMIALIGLVKIIRFVGLRFQKPKSQIIIAVMCIFIVVDLVNVLSFMIKYHPFQNVYFNILAGRNMSKIKERFELDYWGLSYRKAIEYILKNNSNKKIRIFVENYPGRINAFILTEGDRKRIEYVDNPSEAEYFLSNYRWHKEEYTYKNEIYSIKINGAKIMVVYKL